MKDLKIIWIVMLQNLIFIKLLNQEVKVAKSAPFVYATMQSAIGKASKTTKFVVIKNKQQPLYQGAKGGYFYITQTIGGDFKKNYIKIQ